MSFTLYVYAVYGAYVYTPRPTGQRRRLP